MSVLSFIAGIFRPAADLIDDLHTSEEEKLIVKSEIFSLQSEVTLQMLDYEKQLLNAQAKVITAEATGQSWLQRNWRPLTMITFLLLVVCDSFGLLAFRLADQAWTLLQIGLGGYVVGRSVEKTAPKISEIIKR